MTVKEILVGPGMWARYAYAVDGRGIACDPDDPGAQAFCLVGAAQAAYGDGPAYIDALRRLADALGIRVPDDLPTMADVEEFLRNSLVRWNDEPHRTFEEVRALIKRAGV